MLLAARSNKLAALTPLVPRLLAAIDVARPGQALTITTTDE